MMSFRRYLTQTIVKRGLYLKCMIYTSFMVRGQYKVLPCLLVKRQPHPLTLLESSSYMQRVIFGVCERYDQLVRINS